MAQDFSQPNAQPFVLEAGDTAILLIHGFTGSPSHMRLIGDAAQVAGFSAQGIRLPGHGTTVQDMAQSSGEQWLSACTEAYQALRDKYRRVSVGGLSMGGILSLLLAETYDPACVILFAPALRYKNAYNHLSPLVKHFVPFLKGKPREMDPEAFLYAYDYGYGETPVAKVEDMTRLQRMARKNLAKVTCPVLVIQSHGDESVHASVPSTIMRETASQVKETCWVDRSPHVVTIGPDRAYVCDRVIDFLRRYGV